MPTDLPAAAPLGRPDGAPPWWVGAAAVVVLLLVTLDVLHHGALTSFDHATSRQMVRWDLRDRPVKPLIYVLTLFGQRATVLGVTIPLIAYLAWRSRSVDPVFRYGVALALMTAVVYAVKSVTGRTAPVVDLVHAGGASYPSGHVCNSMLVWGLLWATARGVHAPGPLVRVLTVLRIVGPAAVVVGMTLLDYHWISDFLGGASIALILLWLVLHPWWSRVTVPLDRAVRVCAGQ